MVSTVVVFSILIGIVAVFVGLFVVPYVARRGAPKTDHARRDESQPDPEAGAGAEVLYANPGVG